MSDVAQLGIAVDSSQVKAGTNDLRNFEAVAKRTGETVEQVQARFAKLNQQSAGVSREAQKLAPAVQQANQQLQQIAVTSEKTNTSLNRLFGATISMIAMKATKELVSYAWNLNKTLADLADTADRVGISYSKIQGLSTAAAYKGISGDAFNSAMLSFNEQVDQAKNGLGSLGVLLRVNGKTVSDTATTFGIVADLVKNAGSEAQKFSILQQAGLPATREFAKLMEQGKDAINRAADASSKLSKQQLEDAKRLEESWQRMWTDFENWGKKAILNVAGATSEIKSALENALKMQGGGYSNDYFEGGFDPSTGMPLSSGRTPYALPKTLPRANYSRSTQDYPGYGPEPAPTPPTKPATPTVDPEKLKGLMALEQQRIGVLGQMASVGMQVRAVELQIAQARMAGVSVSKSEEANLKRLAEERALGIDQLKASRDAIQVEAATLGMSAGQAQAYTAAQTIFNEKKRLGVELTQAQREAILREAEALGKARDAMEQMKFAHETFNSMFVSFGQNIRNGQNAWDAFANAGTNALGRIADKLMQMAADNLWKAAFGNINLFSLFGGLGGGGAGGNPTVLGGLYHTGGLVGLEGQQRYVHPAYFDHAPKFHSGLMPDEFPAVLQKGEGVFTKGQMAALGGAIKSGSGALSVNVGGTVVNIQGNADNKEIDRLKAELARRDAELPAKIVDVVRKAKTTRNLQ